MHAELRAQVAFRLTGLRAGGADPASDARNFRPALAARYRDLAALRYDFPLVLPFEPAEDELVIPLSTLVDRLLAVVSPPENEDPRLRRAVLRLEHEIRIILAQGGKGTLKALWDLAASRIGARGDAALAATLAPARKALTLDGDVLDCDAAFPAQFVLHAWKAVQKRKAAAFHAEVDRLVFQLNQVLVSDEAHSPQGRSAERLRETFGTLHREVFDFDEMSQLLARGHLKRPLSESRRKRVRSLVVALESQRFFLDESGYTFVFDRCAPALRTFRARYARLRALARSMAMARLEAANEYDEKKHDALFQQMRESPVDAAELARFPDYLVLLNDTGLEGAARAELVDLLSSGVPAKVLLQSDDLLDDAASAEGLAAVGARADALTGLAMGLNGVFVVQSSASNLSRMVPDVLRGLSHSGPALFSVFSGATGDTCCLPAYLNAAVAMESRAFPAFTYDPARESDAGSRLSLASNPQADRDWPVHGFDYEDAQHQRVHKDLAFTLADFVAADERFARHFLVTQDSSVKRVPAGEWLDAAAPEDEASPVVAMVDSSDVLRELVVGESVLNLARRARDRWHGLQRLAAVDSPLLKGAPVVETPEAGATAVPEVAGTAAAAVAAPAAAPAPAPAEAPKASSDEAYIETPRCTTCEECMQINNKLFQYDANKQAYIADINAGTYRQLVEAAESCQVSIIHPGKPRNPDEPDLEELLERAKPFA